LEFMDYVQAIVDGLLFGAVYALIGIGFTLIFGVMNKINMAYAAASFAGAYVSLGIAQVIGLSGDFGLPPFVMFLVSAVAGGVFAYVVYLICFRFTPDHYELASLMATIGTLLMVDEMVVQATNGEPLNYPEVLQGIFDNPMLEFSESFAIRGDLLTLFVVAIIATMVLLWVLFRTKLGLATRAVAQQRMAAQLCGIRVDKTNATTFVIAGVLGGLAGAMIGAVVGTLLQSLVVIPLTIKGLIVTVIGGLGSIPGAIVGGLLVGAFENVFLAIRGVTERDMYVMLLLFVFLAFRPQGLFGRVAIRD
jgi:branched-chain amino acid transport system permease protein